MKDIILKLIDDMSINTFFELSKIVGLSVGKIVKILEFDDVAVYNELDLIFNIKIECLVIYENDKRLFFQTSNKKSEYFHYNENFKFETMYQNITIKEFLNYYDKRRYRHN